MFISTVIFNFVPEMPFGLLEGDVALSRAAGLGDVAKKRLLHGRGLW